MIQLHFNDLFISYLILEPFCIEIINLKILPLKKNSNLELCFSYFDWLFIILCVYSQWLIALVLYSK